MMSVKCCSCVTVVWSLRLLKRRPHIRVTGESISSDERAILRAVRLRLEKEENADVQTV